MAITVGRYLSAFAENFGAAIGSVRGAKMRSTLTVLGVVIGVSTVMAIASVVQGIQEQIVHTIELAGPTTFYVLKVFSQTPLNPQDLPKWIRVRPNLQEEEAARIRRLPEIYYAGMWGQTLGR